MSCPHLPAVDDDGRVQRALMQAVGVHLLDEAQQVAGAVRQASAGGWGMGALSQTQSEPTSPPDHHHICKSV